MKVTASRNIIFDGVQRLKGAEFDVSDDEGKRLQDAGFVSGAGLSQSKPKPKTKAELLAEAEKEGLKLEVTEVNTVAEIKTAIDDARAAASA